MRLMVRRIQMQPQKGRGDINYLIFCPERGEGAPTFDRPIIMNQFQFEQFLEQANDEAEDES